jgi:hypothetical protein
MEMYTHNFSPDMKITVDKIKILGITIPTNGKYEDLIKLNYDEKKVKTVLRTDFSLPSNKICVSSAY